MIDDGFRFIQDQTKSQFLYVKLIYDYSNKLPIPVFPRGGEGVRYLHQCRLRVELKFFWINQGIYDLSQLIFLY